MITITETQKLLVEDNHNLIYSFLHKYNLSIDDYYGLAAIGMCKAAKEFKDGKVKFSTYAYKCMFTTVFSEERKKTSAKRIPLSQLVYYQKEIKEDDKLSAFEQCLSTGDDMENNILTKIIFDKYINNLENKEKQILLLLNKGYSQKTVGKLTGYSQPQISRIKKKLRNALAM